MKTYLILLGLAGAAAAGPTMTDRITPEEIAARQKATTPFNAIPRPVIGAEGQVANPAGQSLINQSEILNDGIHWTLVPKGAVLHIPPAFSDRVGAKPLGKLLTWTEFLTANRNWLFTEEVTLDLAAGKKPFALSRQEAWNKGNKVVIAVLRGGPISVRNEPNAPVALVP
jgi:hypothetical protein